MDGESGYDGGSEASASLSSAISRSDCKEKKPCEICGSNSNAHEIMICFRCQETREHTYCARVNLPSVPPMWLCEVCRRPNSSNVVDLAANRRTNQVEEEAVDSEDSAETVDQKAPPTTNQVVNNEAGPSSSRTTQVEQAVGNASDESSSPES